MDHRVSSNFTLWKFHFFLGNFHRKVRSVLFDFEKLIFERERVKNARFRSLLAKIEVNKTLNRSGPFFGGPQKCTFCTFGRQGSRALNKVFPGGKIASTFDKKLVEALSTNFCPFLPAKVRPRRAWAKELTSFVQKGARFQAMESGPFRGHFPGLDLQKFSFLKIFWKFSEKRSLGLVKKAGLEIFLKIVTLDWSGAFGGP